MTAPARSWKGGAAVRSRSRCCATGSPVLGVVYAPTSPDRGPDLIAWAEGSAITRNGVRVAIDLSHRELAATDVVFLNHGAGQRPVWNSTACTFARFMPLPSIAYRLARVAVGDGIATVTLRPVNAHDIVAGHALLTAAGGVLVAEDGMEVTYERGWSTAAPLPASAVHRPRWRRCARRHGAAAANLGESRWSRWVGLGWRKASGSTAPWAACWGW